jgi:hypothetical protein
MAAESFYTKLGRIIHDLQIVNMINTTRMQYPPSVNTGVSETDDVNSGYTRQQETLYKQLVKKIFADTNKGNVIQVKNVSFAVILPQNINGVMSITIPAGIVDTIFMGAFPHATTVMLYPPGHPPLTYPNVGAVHSTRTRTRNK